MKVVRVGSRESALAIAQARIVIKAINRWDPTVLVELVTMKTTGDKRLEESLDKIGGKGVFVKELEQALLNGTVDICVHSLKDMAVEEHPDLPLVAVGTREDPRDVLVLPLESQFPDPSLPIGCSSGRRALQLRALYPDHKVAPIRGNIITRLEKLDRGDFGALVLAAAGLRRLKLNDRMNRPLSTDEMIPACGQGILAVQARKGSDTGYLDGFRDNDSRDMALAERAFVRTLEGGCTSPVGVIASVNGNELHLSGYAVSANDRMIPGASTGQREDAERLGAELALRLKREADSGE